MKAEIFVGATLLTPVKKIFSQQLQTMYPKGKGLPLALLALNDEPLLYTGLKMHAMGEPLRRYVASSPPLSKLNNWLPPQKSFEFDFL